jgi:hypothetical protein
LAGLLFLFRAARVSFWVLEARSSGRVDAKGERPEHLNNVSCPAPRARVECGKAIEARLPLVQSALPVAVT